jgi:predicted permease
MMRLPPGITALFRLAIRRPRDVEREIDDEIAFHVAERADALTAAGWSRDDAIREARRRFGDSTDTRRALSAAATQRERRLDMLDQIDNVRQDLVVAARQLKRSPAFAFGTIAAFALGIGANATMFNVLDRLLLRPPAQVLAADEIYTLRVPTRAHVSQSATSYPIFAALRDQLAGTAPVAMQSFPAGVAVSDSNNAAATGAIVQSVMVDGNYFPTLGVSAALGRLIGADDARLPDGQPVAVIGYGLWRRQFGGDRSIVGREIRVGTERVRIVGVAPEGFNGAGIKPIDLWIPVTMAPRASFLGPEWSTSNLQIWLFSFTRVRPGVDPAQVESRATAAFRSVPQRGASEGMPGQVELRSILPSRASTLSPEAKVAAMLGAVAVLVLLIACSNAANLMLARAVRRRREIGVRMALGGSHRRIAAQLLTDALFLAALGGVAALVVAAAGSAFMRSVLLAGYAWTGSLVDGRTVLFIAGAVVVAGVLTGVVPAVLLRRFDLSSAIGEGRQAGGVHRQRVISALVVAQTTLSVMLLIGAALFVRSLRAVHRVPLGIDAEHSVTIELNTRTMHLTDASGDALFGAIASSVARVPAVKSAAIADGSPFGWSMGVEIHAPGVPDDSPVIKRGANRSAVTSEYFNTIGTRIIEGRAFTSLDDRADAPLVAVLSARLAKLLWPATSAVGRCVKLGADSVPCRLIVGVAEDTHSEAIVEDEPSFPHVYVPLSQGWHSFVARVVIARTTTPTLAIPLIRDAVRRAAPDAPLPEIGTMSAKLAPELRPWRLGAIMFGAFGGLSLVLATLGMYSVIAYGVAQRRQEMGIRVALGARGPQILALVSRDGGRLAVIGAIAGVAVAAALAPMLQPLLYGVSARAIGVYAAVAIGMVVVAVVACLIPARDAARTSPMVAIRAD